MKRLMAAGILCTSSLFFFSFTDSSYQKNGMSTQNKPSTSTQDNATGDSWADDCGDRFELNIFDQNDQETLYSKYGYSRGDMHHIFKYGYDTKTVETFRGTVDKVMRARYPDGDCYVLLILKTDDGDYLVNLGPVWYIDENGLVVNEGDSLQVRGSKVRMNGRFLIISAEIKKDGEVLKFRDSQGQSTWGAQPSTAAPQKNSSTAPTNPNRSYQGGSSTNMMYQGGSSNKGTMGGQNPRMNPSTPSQGSSY